MSSIQQGHVAGLLKTCLSDSPHSWYVRISFHVLISYLLILIKMVTMLKKLAMFSLLCVQAVTQTVR